MSQIRPLQLADVDQMVHLIELKRMEYQVYRPEFWKKTANSAELSRSYFGMMVSSADWCVLGAFDGQTMTGFISAREVPVPPVYDGVRTCVVDDFTVIERADWKGTGRELLERFKTEAQARGWRQIVVICGAMDEAKASMLNDAGLLLTTNWWTVRLP
jgi:L-amino acid N-acyltransferase YncA